MINRKKWKNDPPKYLYTGCNKLVPTKFDSLDKKNKINTVSGNTKCPKMPRYRNIDTQILW